MGGLNNDEANNKFYAGTKAEANFIRTRNIRQGTQTKHETGQQKAKSGSISKKDFPQANSISLYTCQITKNDSSEYRNTK